MPGFLAATYKNPSSSPSCKSFVLVSGVTRQTSGPLRSGATNVCHPCVIARTLYFAVRRDASFYANRRERRLATRSVRYSTGTLNSLMETSTVVREFVLRFMVV